MPDLRVPDPFAARGTSLRGGENIICNICVITHLHLQQYQEKLPEEGLHSKSQADSIDESLLTDYYVICLTVPAVGLAPLGAP